MWSDSDKKSVVEKQRKWGPVAHAEQGIILLTDYEQANDIFKANKSIEIEGIVKKIPSSDMVNVVETWRKTNQAYDNIMSEYYVDSKHGLRQGLVNPKVPVEVYFYSWLLIVSYISLIFDFPRIRRFLKFY